MGGYGEYGFYWLMFRVLDNLDEGAYLIDSERKITFWNRSAERITGFTADEVIGRMCADNILNHVDQNGLRLCGDNCPLVEVMSSGEEQEARVFLHHKDGSRVPVKVHALPWKYSTGEREGVLELFSDTSEIKITRRKIDQLHEELYFDPLTKVGNRRLCDRELTRFLGDYQKNRASFAAVICDIDDFKRVNDSYGHDFGDRILCMTAGTLKEALRDDDVVCRWGGEEFMMLLPGVHSEAELYSIYNRILVMIRNSFLLSGSEKVGVTASFGATIMKEGDDGDTLFKRADVLLFQSKREGKDRVKVG